MRTFMLNSIQESKMITYAPKMTDILGFQGVYSEALGISIEFISQMSRNILSCPYLEITG